MKDFLKKYIDVRPGEIREVESDKVLGYHEGAVFYTIGQRHGLYLNGMKGEVNDGMPYYVVAKDTKQNIVYVSKNLNDKRIWVRELKLRDMVFRAGPAELSSPKTLQSKHSGGSPPSPSFTYTNLSVRLRHRAPLIPAELDGNTLKFAQEIKRPASGQSAVFYLDEVCLGGGIII